MHVELFHRWRCPYSARVRDFVARHHLEDQIFYRATDEDAGAQDVLLDLTGGQKVPCLLVDGTPIFETDQIVHWLRENMLHQGERHFRPFGLPVHAHPSP